jgi:hypothetical protein
MLPEHILRLRWRAVNGVFVTDAVRGGDCAPNLAPGARSLSASGFIQCDGSRISRKPPIRHPVRPSSQDSVVDSLERNFSRART